MKIQFKEKQMGITLIALVITIIVLLILAGISIAMLTGENGILTQASTSKERTERAEAIERAKLDIMDWRAEEISNGRAGTVTNDQIKTILTGKDYVKVIEGNPGAESFVSKEGHTILYSELYAVTEETGGEEAEVGQIVTGTSNKTYTTEDGTAKIPVGFMIVPGCDDISEGLVISDNPEDTEEDSENIVAEGNQFVWIPVTNLSQYVRNTTYSSTEISAAAYTVNGYLPEGIQPIIEAGVTDVDEIGLINEEAEREAVLSAGGFYIGRYEAGLEEAIILSKKNVSVYEDIGHEEAKVKAKTFIDNDNIKSALISGIQWDVTMATINGKLDGNRNVYDVTIASYDEETSNRHTGDVEYTGQNISDKVYNIYDLEGNYCEYVAEKHSAYENSSEVYVVRGGCEKVGFGVASQRSFSKGFGRDDEADLNFTFRIALYVM